MKSWKLNIQVAEKLQINPSTVLTVAELHVLQGLLQSGWQHEIVVKRANG